MKRSVLLMGLMSILLLSFSSCVGYRHMSGVRTFTDATYRVNTNINDYTLLGETEITVELRTYLGIIKVIDKVNGEEFNRTDQKIVSLEGMLQAVRMDNSISKAMYKALEEYPDADYYMPVSTKIEIEKLFLGNHKLETVRVKAYKLN